MNDILLLILSIIGLIALYWVLAGQWKFNKMMQEQVEIKEEEIRKDDKSDTV